MPIEERALPPPLQQRMACNQAVIFKNPNLISKAVNLDNAPPGCIRDRIVIAADTDNFFMADPALKLEDRAERNQGQWLKCRHLLGEGLVDGAAILILADDGCLHTVIENLAWHAVDRLERSPMASKHARHRLTQYEPPPDHPRDAQRHGKESDNLHLVRRIGKAKPDLHKVDLGLLARWSLEPHGIGLATVGRTHRPHHARAVL